MTFWADNIYKNEHYIIIRIVSKTDINKSCNLIVEINNNIYNIKINIRRIYVFNGCV